MFKDKLSNCDVLKLLIQLLIGLHPHLKLIYSNSPAVYQRSYERRLCLPFAARWQRAKLAVNPSSSAALS